MDREGAIIALTWFFGFRATKSPKMNLGTFLALKTTWKAILDNFRFLSLATKGRQISMDITVEKSKISKILSFNGVMHLKWKLRTCTIQIELEKIGFISKKKKMIFFDFRLMLEDPQKFSTSNFFNFLKNKYQNCLSGTRQISQGAKSGSLVNVALTSWQQETDSW